MRTNSTTPADETTLFLGDGWSDPLEAGIRDRIRDFIEELIEEELAAALGRGRYERRRHDDDAPGVDVYCATVMRQAAAAVMRPDPWPVAGRP